MKRNLGPQPPGTLWACNGTALPLSNNASRLQMEFNSAFQGLRTLSTDQMKWRQIIGYFINHIWETILKEVVLHDLNFYPGIWWRKLS
jgi:hypothetical protein